MTYPTKKFGDKIYLEIIDGDRGKNYPKRIEFNKKGFCLFLNTSNVRKGFFNFDKLDFITEKKYNLLGKGKAFKNDIILTTRGTIGNTALIENIFPYEYVRINSGMVVLRVNLELFFPKYLIHFINSNDFNNQKNNLVSGSAQPQLPIGVMKNISIPLPPLPTQKLIVQKLDSAFKNIHESIKIAKKNIENIEELNKSSLVEIFKNGKIKNVKLSEITTILGDGLHGTPKYCNEGEYYFINGNNLNDGDIIIKDGTKKVDISEYKKYKKILNKNTVFVSINGTLGKSAFYNNEKIILGKSACYFNLFETIDKYYIRYFIKSQYFIDYMNYECTGATIKNVSLKSMRNLTIPLPPLSKQKDIVSYLDKVFEKNKVIKEGYEKKLKELEEMKQSILKEAFEGRLVKE